MKTETYHISNLGSFGGGIPTDSQGYVTRHVSPRYAQATNEELDAWTRSKLAPVRAAALTEQADRAIRAWRDKMAI